MANHLRGEIDITFGGQTYVMRATFGFIATVEGTLNLPTLELWSLASTSRLPIKDMVTIIQAGLREGGTNLSAGKIGDLLLAEKGGRGTSGIFQCQSSVQQWRAGGGLGLHRGSVVMTGER